MAKSARAAFANQLAEWRRERFDEMEANLRVWKEIRDDQKQSAKDRGEAAKNISKALGGLSADRTAIPTGNTNPSSPKEEAFELSPEKRADIDALLDSLNGSSN
jgi:hypothetical protein